MEIYNVIYSTSFEDLREEGDEPESTNFGYGADIYDYGSGAKTKYRRMPWYKDSFGAANGGAVIGAARTGNVSLKLSQSITDNCPYYAYRVDDVSPGQRFISEVWAKGECDAFIAAEFFRVDGSSAGGYHTTTVKNGAEWSRHADAADAPVEAAYMEVRLGIRGAGTAYFDDLTVYATPAPVKGTLANGNMEETGEPGQAAAWTRPVNDPAGYSRAESGGFSGGAYALIAGRAGQYSQQVPVREGERFELSAYVKTTGDGFATLRLNWLYDVPQIIWAQAAPDFVLESTVTGPVASDGWTRQKISATAPRSASGVDVILEGSAVSGSVGFDGVALCRTAGQYAGDKVKLTVTGKVTTGHFYGFGSHGDYRLTCPVNTDNTKYPWLNGDCVRDPSVPGDRGRWTETGSDGKYVVRDKDVKLWRDKTMAFRPQIMRMFFAYQWWCNPRTAGDVEYFNEPGKYTPELKDFIDWIFLLNEAGTDVLIAPWGDSWAYPVLWRDEARAVNVVTKQAPGDMQRLPLREYRDDMIAALTAFLDYLINGLKLENVKYVTLMNEPDCMHTFDYLEDDFVYIDEVWETSRRLTAAIRENPGIRKLHIVGVDHATRQAQGGNKQPNGAPKNALEMLTHMADKGLDWADSVAVHTYMNPNTALMKNFLGFDYDYMKNKGINKPIWIPEFGYGELTTYTLSEIEKYYYGMWMMDFAVSSLKNGVAALLNFYYGDCYLGEDGTKQNTGLWRTQTDGWVNKPGYYAWSLVNRYTESGSEVLSVEIGDDAEWFFDSVALRGPVDGKITVFAINKSYRQIEMELSLADPRGAVFDAYVYTAAAVPRNESSPDLIGSSGAVTVPAGGTGTFVIPPQSFVILTEIKR